MNGRSEIALIGDLIGSRSAKNRAGLQRSLRRALDLVNSLLRPMQMLEPTVGDEFQGVFGDVGSAARATLLLRLQLLRDREVDSRYGLGSGSLTVFEERTPLSQDAPAWWAARGGIDRAQELAGEGRTDFVRTWFTSAETEPGTALNAHLVNSTLLCRDALISQMRPRSRRLLLGLLLEKPQADLAAEEEISQSAVSQNLAASGAYAVRAADLELRAEVR
jgi:SatD family (SatD)